MVADLIQHQFLDHMCYSPSFHLSGQPAYLLFTLQTVAEFLMPSPPPPPRNLEPARAERPLQSVKEQSGFLFSGEARAEFK